jgi:seryl-tRNA synthetase
VIDLKLLQKDFDSVATLLEKKQVKTELLDELKERTSAYKKALADFENNKAEQNKISKQFGMLKAKGEDIAPLQAQVAELKKEVSRLNSIANEKEESLNALALTIPNLPSPSVPEGKSEEENVELRKVLEPKTFSFTPKEHHDLGVDLGWLDFERGVKLAKSRFTVLKNDAARLERALINYMLDFNRKRGFEEVWVPAIANRDSLQGTGQLPKFADDLFKIEDEELYLIPTAEVPLTNLFRNEILSSDELPIMMTGYTACYRKEAGSAGRDTHGIIRQHQFDKVEMVCLTKPQESQAMFEKMVTCASDLLTSLELPHRVVSLCGGDLGFSAQSTIDLEVWLPGQNMYREISSISNVGDFQARRAKIRFKEAKKNLFVNTLNGSSLAVGRTLVALMENGQNEDGTITIPEVLKPYLTV